VATHVAAPLPILPRNNSENKATPEPTSGIAPVDSATANGNEVNDALGNSLENLSLALVRTSAADVDANIVSAIRVVSNYIMTIFIQFLAHRLESKIHELSI
jgi:hypothetical protein